MTEKSDFNSPPPYSEAGKQQGYTQPGGYPPQPGYAQQGGYPPQGGYPQQGYPQQYGQQQTTAVVVTQPGMAGQVMYTQRPPDYMAASIFACLCCFWPTGLCAIYYASQANNLASVGDMAGATSMANNARNLMITSIVIGIIWITLVIVLRVVVYSSYYSY